MTEPVSLYEKVFNHGLTYGDPHDWVAKSVHGHSRVVDTRLNVVIPSRVVLDFIALLRQDKSDMYNAYQTQFHRAKCGRMAERGIICPCGVDHTMND